MDRRSFFKLAIGSAAVAALAKISPAKSQRTAYLVYSADGSYKGVLYKVSANTAKYSYHGEGYFPENGDLVVDNR